MRAFFSRNLVVVLLAGFALNACGSDMDDLDQYINEIKARPGGSNPCPKSLRTKYSLTRPTRTGCARRSFRILRKFRVDLATAVPGRIRSGVASSSRAFRWIPCAWLEHWCWVKQATA